MPSDRVDLARKRYDIEDAESWREWISRIPAIPFPAGWHVRMSPPFSGALVRFRVSLDGKRENETSVYLDAWDRIGYYGAPYWEVYPFEEDVGRCAMDDVASLLSMITASLAQERQS